ncbi:hypothetical protein K439DRAFT_1645156 [Ramaria rubella]|nr:hypothetical protein K439DRAFT_1645156 [Ramaria rubella]
MLGVDQASQPASIYDNPQLYPQAFPWLFPYDLGGVENMNGAMKVPEKLHLKHLMLYHDKRFQTDPDFPLVAFNHLQIKDSSTGSFLLADRVHFDDIVECLLSINIPVLTHMIDQMKNDEMVMAVTEDEKSYGSGTMRKFMRNECWSLLAYLGAPTWYITFSPADVKHPIALYLDAQKEKIRPVLNINEANYKLIADNPVASARFFHIIVQAFIKHVIGLNEKETGLYGRSSGYYGTVEQQEQPVSTGNQGTCYEPWV